MFCSKVKVRKMFLKVNMTYECSSKSWIQSRSWSLNSYLRLHGARAERNIYGSATLIKYWRELQHIGNTKVAQVPWFGKSPVLVGQYGGENPHGVSDLPDVVDILAYQLRTHKYLPRHVWLVLKIFLWLCNSQEILPSCKRVKRHLKGIFLSTWNIRQHME
jgi:hypothetical protein